MPKKRQKKKKKQGVGGFGFNQNDPLAIGLVAYFTFNQGVSCLEVLRNVYGAPSTSIPAYFQKEIFTGLLAGESGVNWFVSLPDSGLFEFTNSQISDSGLTAELSIVFRGRIRADGNTLTSFQICGKHAGNGATANPFDFSCDYGANPRLRIVRANGGFQGWGSPADITLDRSHTLGVTCGKDISTPAIFYHDGQRQQAAANGGGGGTGGATGSGATLRIGRRADDATKFRGGMERILIYKRILTSTEHMELALFPDSFFTENVNFPAVAAGAVTATFSGNANFHSSFVLGPFFRSGVNFASTFRLFESFASWQSGVNFASSFTPCISSDIFTGDIGSGGRYRR